MEKYKFDIVAQTLTVSAKFAAKMNDPESNEYKLYQQFKTDFPGLTVARGTHRTPTAYKAAHGDEQFRHNPYKGITYENMERFIAAVDDSSSSYREEYDHVCAYARSLEAKRAYGIVANWFIEQFPKYRTDPFYYYKNRPKVICFNPRENRESISDAALTGTDG